MWNNKCQWNMVVLIIQSILHGNLTWCPNRVAIYAKVKFVMLCIQKFRCTIYIYIWLVPRIPYVCMFISSYLDLNNSLNLRYNMHIHDESCLRKVMRLQWEEQNLQLIKVFYNIGNCKQTYYGNNGRIYQKGWHFFCWISYPRSLTGIICISTCTSYRDINSNSCRW